MALAFQFYGRFGGPGWTNNSYQPPPHPDFWMAPQDTLDNVFREHDKAYWHARDRYDHSTKTGFDRAQFWQSTIVADVKLRTDLDGMRSRGELGVPGDLKYGKAAQADAAFAAKAIDNYNALGTAATQVAMLSRAGGRMLP
jgi:hypothetical protein